MIQALKVRLARTMCHPSIGKVIRARYGGVIPNRGCRIDVRQKSIAPETVASLFWGFYESAEIRFVNRYLPREFDVVELGASLGAVSAHAARRLDAGRRLVSVEANPELLQLIAANVQSNAPWVHHEVVNAAISYEGTPSVRFAIADRNIHSALASEGREGRVVDIPAISVSALLYTRNLNEYSLVSDVEGAEAQILRFDRDALNRCRFILIELHRTQLDSVPVHVEEMRSQFEGMGFRLVDRRGPVCAFERSS